MGLLSDESRCTLGLYLAVYVPQLLLREIHCAVGGHLGSRETTHALLLHVWWHGFSQDVSAFVRGFAICYH